MRLLGTDGLAPVEWLYLKMALTGLGNPDAQYVICLLYTSRCV